MRITNKVFYDLAIWMVFLGLCIGTVFPYFVMLLGVPGEIALKPLFFAACLGAGALAGIVNYTLARWIVGIRLKVLASRMSHVEQNLHEMTFSGDTSTCTPENCQITVDSADELGESAAAFNRLVESLAKSIQSQMAVRSFAHMLTSELKVEALTDKALEHFFTHTSAAAGLIVYECQGQMTVGAARGINDPEQVIASEQVREAVRIGRKQVIVETADAWTTSRTVDFRPAEILILPIIAKGLPLGAVVLVTEYKFAANDLCRIDLFIQGLGLALNNAKAHAHLQHLAAIDPLTGIFNRRFGMRRLQEEFSKAVRGSGPFGLLLLDIDHFKVINDTHGHLVGDCTLKAICAVAKASLRDSDIFFRYGGEEFVAVLPASSVEDLWLSGERLRIAIEQEIIAVDDKTLRVTVCIGGASFPDQPVENVDQLIHLADEALYEAKNGGRNKVQIACNASCCID